MRIALVTIVFFAVATAAKKQTVGVDGKKVTRKLRANNKIVKAASLVPGVDDKLAEDEGYWDRFLQADESVTPSPTPNPTPPPTPGDVPPPTPGPTPPATPPPSAGPCEVDVSKKIKCSITF